MQKLQAKAAEAIKHAQSMEQQNKAMNQKAANLWFPKTAQEAKDMQASPLNYRLPQTPRGAGRKVESLASRGAGAVYALDVRGEVTRSPRGCRR